jgi:aconitate hydratase
MGVLPLQFDQGQSAASLGLTGREVFDIAGNDESLAPGARISVRTGGGGGFAREFGALVRVDTPEEMTAYRHGGILPYVLRKLAR